MPAIRICRVWGREHKLSAHDELRKRLNVLGNCIIRTPIGGDKRLDVGVLCEALLFFSKTHVVLDQGTLRLFAEGGFLDDFIEMLERGYVSASYTADTPGLVSQTTGGLSYRPKLVTAGIGTAAYRGGA
jgi:hypothetical protein